MQLNGIAIHKENIPMQPNFSIPGTPYNNMKKCTLSEKVPGRKSKLRL